jgi:pilus assembly protein CpaE
MDTGNKGKLIVVASAKGGVGRTVMSVNLALALLKMKYDVCLLDGNFQFGDCSAALDIHPGFSIKDMVDEMSIGDSLRGYLTEHSTGLKVIPAPPRPELAELVTNEAVEKIMKEALSEFDYVVCDTAVGLNDKTIQLMDLSDQVLVITTLEMTSLKNTRLFLETLGLLGNRSKAKIILNRSTMESVIPAGEVGNILGETEIHHVPNDFSTVYKSLNIGLPFVLSRGRPELSRAIYRLAQTVSSQREKTVTKGKSSVLSKWLYPKKKGRE